MGIHYDYKSTRGAKKMQKQQERGLKLIVVKTRNQSVIYPPVLDAKKPLPFTP